jgi:predicted HTH domain antitoxin
MNQLTIPYPEDLLWALQQEPHEFEENARLLLAVKLYGSGKLSTGLSAQLAGVSRSAFIFLLSQHGLSPFAGESSELEDDLSAARRASSRQYHATRRALGARPPRPAP